ncbi:MAG: hypothetical protein ACRDYC_05610 [Acidimicrobiales bacterium]
MGAVGKLGAKAPRVLYGLRTLDAYCVGPLPAPRAMVPVPAETDWGMFGNNTVGDCVIAGCAHALIAWDTESAESDPIPTDAAALAQYYALTGGPDTGLVISEVLQTWQTSGLFGGKPIAAFCPINFANVLDLHCAVDFYGDCKLGVALPQSAMDQTAANQPWTVVPGSPIIGGHDVEIVGYDPAYVQIVTWGEIVDVSYPWLAQYVTEAYAIIPNEFIEAGKGPDLDLKTLQADLASLGTD